MCSVFLCFCVSCCAVCSRHRVRTSSRSPSSALPTVSIRASAATKRRSACISWSTTTCSRSTTAARHRRPGRRSWEQADPLTYVVHLRKGVRFHDGHELTADDVVLHVWELHRSGVRVAAQGRVSHARSRRGDRSVHRPLLAQGAVRLVSDPAGDAGRAEGRRARAARPADRHRPVQVRELRGRRPRRARRRFPTTSAARRPTTAWC